MKPEPTTSMRGAVAPVEVSLFGGFLLAGVLTVLLGPLISELLARGVITQAQAALLFPAQFATSALGSVLSSRHLRRSPQLGYLTCAAGLAVLSLQSWPLLLVGTALLGGGLGLVIPSSNLLVAQRHAERRAAPLARLNLIWSLGAVGCPLLFVAVSRGLALAALVGALSLLSLIAGVAVVLAFRRQPSATFAPAAKAAGGVAVPVGRLLALGSMLLLYVGAESALGGWLVTVADRIGEERSLVSLLIGSGFWAALLVGRAATPLALRSLSEVALYRVALGLAGAGTLALLLVGTRSGVAVAALAAGLGLAPIFPLTVSRIAAETHGGSRAGWVFVGSGVGGASLPWLTARVGDLLAELQHGLVVPLAALALLALLAQRRGP